MSPEPERPRPVTAADAASARPAWTTTRVDPFVFAAWLDGRCWVLRLNDFPEHPLFTLFVDGAVIGDLDDPPGAWGLRADPPELDQARRQEVVDLMAHLGPYGAERGEPCDGDWCTCSILTEARVRTVVGDDQG